MKSLLWISALAVVLAGCQSATPGGVADTSKLTATAASPTSANLTWVAVSGATTYRLERRTGSGAFAVVKGDLTGTTYTDTGLAPSTAYTYRLKTLKGTAASRGTETSLTTPADNSNGAPANPATFSATATSTTSVNLSWSAVSGAARYSLERTNGGTFGLISDQITGTTYTSTGLTANTEYTYRVRAINAQGSSSGVTRVVRTLSTNPTETRFRVEDIKGGLGVVWSMAFAPDGRLFYTLRDESRVRLYALDLESRNVTTYASNASVRDDGEGGVLGMIPDPNFAQNNRVFICYSYWRNGTQTNENKRNRVSAFTLSGGSLTGEDIILDDMLGWVNHNGCRLAVSPDNTKLFISMGEAADAPSNVSGEPGGTQKAQSLRLLSGKIFRVNLDGSIPADNPFYTQVSGDARATWTLGHRNPQGLAFQPGTGALWSTEHGPDVKDELNVIKAGRNYGWPNCRGTDSCNLPNYQAAVREYEGGNADTIAPSNLTFYTGNAFPAWQGNLFFVTLKTERLYRLVVSGESVSSQQILIDGGHGRLRDVLTGPDGYLYLSGEMGIKRLVPSN